VPRSIKDLKVRLDSETRAMTSELGRAPTAAELAERTDSSVEQVLEVFSAATAHRPDSLDKPLGEDGEDNVIDRSGGHIDPGFNRAEDAAVVGALVTQLPEREQTILDLRFEQDLTQAEIADQLGISQMHVSRLIRRSIEQLQRSAHVR
jgi:RNA polymerase sigma-B factor